MTNLFAAISKKAVKLTALCMLAGILFVGGSAAAQVVVEVAPPPDEFIAVNPPVYFEGHPAYWYGGHWHYRDGYGHWNYYHQEPGFLAERRMHMAPAPHYYERHEEHRDWRRR